MKRATLLGMAVVAVVALFFYHEKGSKSAETIPPEPAGISIYK